MDKLMWGFQQKSKFHWWSEGEATWSLRLFPYSPPPPLTFWWAWVTFSPWRLAGGCLHQFSMLKLVCQHPPLTYNHVSECLLPYLLEILKRTSFYVLVCTLKNCFTIHNEYYFSFFCRPRVCRSPIIQLLIFPERGAVHSALGTCLNGEPDSHYCPGCW